MRYKKTNDNNIAAFVGGKSYLVTPESPNYDNIYDALREGDREKFDLYIVDEDNLNKFCEGYIQFENGCPTWDGVPMPDIFTDRILDLVRDGESFHPMINFAANLAENPSDHSILELIDFLRHKYLPITKDGCFLAYKVVRSDYKDIYSGTIDNSVGQEPKVDRSQVDPDRQRECSHGLHVGAIEYIQWYGGLNINRLDETDNKVIVVKVNPKDVVSVPRDHEFRKLRCCGYRVVGDFNGVLEDAVYDDTMFMTKKEDTEANAFGASAPVEATTKAGWRNTLKDKLARISNLFRSAKNA